LIRAQQHSGPAGTSRFLRDALDSGRVPGPHLQVSGPALGITGGHCDSNLLPEQYKVKAEGVAAHAHGTEGIRYAIQAGVDSIEHSSLIAVEGDPLQDISELERVIFVMKGGEIERWDQPGH
jgi:imidazolonepropionase-like amidohydrolase